MTETLIECREVCKNYDMGGEVIHALRDVSLEIHRGEHVAVTGASGSGKSTLMNILGCLDRPSSGHYYIAGQDVARNPLLFGVDKVKEFLTSLYLKVVLVLSLIAALIYGLWRLCSNWNRRKPTKKIHRRY